MDQLVAAIQQAALQQQMCSMAGMMGMQMPFAQGMNPMHFVGSGYGYGQAEGADRQLMYPQNGPEDEDVTEEDEDDDEQYRTLFCSNLDERVTEEILYEVFLQAGPIESARIPLDNNGRQRNFGFVTYQHKSAAPFAMELYQGLELFQKKVTIRHQCADKPKPPVPGLALARNPFSQDFTPPMLPPNDQPGVRHHARHSMHDGKHLAPHGKYNNNDQRRRSDSAVIERNRQRPHHQQQQHNNSNRRSDQRYNRGKRRLIKD